MFRLLPAVLLLTCCAAACSAAVAPPTWRIGETTYRFDARARTVTATVGATTFEALAGCGPLVAVEGKPCKPGDLDVRLVSTSRARDTVIATYRATPTAVGGQPFPYTLTIEPAPDALRLTFHSGSTSACMLSAGVTKGFRDWRRFTYMRNGEAYGQPFWPRVAWSPSQGVYVAARWDMAASNGTIWESHDERLSGTGDFAAALDVAYHPRTDGSRLPLHEVLDLRAGKDLWKVAAPPSQKPSPHAAELARSVFLDVWGGTARETEYFLRHLAKLTQGRTRFYTVLEDWETGGFDALLPDSIRMPDYPPNEGVGSIEELAKLSVTAKSMGRYAMRTNYMIPRDAAPSIREGKTRAGTGEDGKPVWHTRPSDWHALSSRQEAEIHRLFATNAGFTDQLTSSAGPWGYLESDPSIPNAGSMREALRLQRQLAQTINDTTGGPLGSETNMDEQLLGQWVSTGDFGIFDGYHRAFTPEFKLRRIHRLSTFHGMGLMYRYFEMPPFPKFSSGKTTYLTDPAQYDDYRAAEVLFGNGGYLFYYPGMPWDYVMTECLLVGTLQKHYALQPVRSVEYWLDGRWQTLGTVLKAGIDPTPNPWGPSQPECLKRIRVGYANGLTLVVNRLAEECDVKAGSQTIRLPKSGWVAWTADGKLLAYSAYAPGTAHRVDFIRDAGAKLQYLNPRGERVLGEDRPCLWLDGKPAVRLDPKTGDAWVRGTTVAFKAPVREPAHRIDFRFNENAQGWRAASCLGPMRIVDGRLTAEIVGEDPYIVAPPIDLAPDTVKTIVIRMKVTCGTFGQLYFNADGVKATGEEMCIHFDVKPGPDVQEVRIPVGDHPLWRGHRIVNLRLDPEHGAFPGEVAIESIRGE